MPQRIDLGVESCRLRGAEKGIQLQERGIPWRPQNRSLHAKPFNFSGNSATIIARRGWTRTVNAIGPPSCSLSVGCWRTFPRPCLHSPRVWLLPEELVAFLHVSHVLPVVRIAR